MKVMPCLCRVFFLLLVASCLAGAGGESAMAAQGEPSVSTKQYGAMKGLAEQVDKFRLLAGSSPDQARQAYFDKSAQETWKKTLGPTFDKSQMMLVDFFAGAVVWIGGITDEQQGVVCYYNPWSDIVFLTDWRLTEKGGRIVDMVMLPGEDLRTEPLKQATEMPPWLKQQGAPGVSIAQQYFDTLKSFNKRFPTFSNAHLGLAAVKRTGAEEKYNLNLIFGRLGARIKMFVAYLDPKKAQPSEKAARAKILELRQAIGGREPGQLTRMVDRALPPEMVQNIFMIPPAIRGEMVENLYLRQGDKALVALVNPRWPLWFTLVHMNVMGDKAKVEALELLQFDATATVVAGVQQQKEVRP